ncbi:MAG: redoxin domain-containing protein [Planctomycetota bacterium]
MARFTIALMVLGAWIAPLSAETESQSPLGKKVDSFKLGDFRGKQVALSDYTDQKAVVVAFLGTECPVAKLYVPRLVELAKTYADRGVAFLAVDSNQQDSIAELAAFARNYSLNFPLLKDPSNLVADQFGAERTPEVFVLDGKHVIRYRGRIDDQYGVGQSSGYAKPKAHRHDLTVALDELLAGNAVSVPETKATGCLIGRISKKEPAGEVTYSNTIAKILQDRCVECHRAGEVAPFTLTSYSEVVGWAPMMAEVIDQGTMPPWFANPEYGHFSNDARLSDDEKKAIHAWIANGCPEGDPKDLPKPREYAEGWRISKPDLVVKMSDKPYTIPAEGVVEYQYFTVDPGFTEDKWIQEAEAKPGNRGVVHHIIVFIQPPSSKGDFRRRGGLAGYAPGNIPRAYPLGVANFVPAGSKLIFQMHYTPNGTEQQDLSEVGLVFADPKTVKKKVHGGAAINPLFRIPPGANNHRVESRYQFKEDMLLTNMTPHMHLRGKSFRFQVEYPDGKSEILLDVPRYDFNWQLRYELAEPKLMPAGTVLRCVAHFDNSEENLANPNPKETVRWGDQTFEEMMIGFFGALAINDDAHSAGVAKTFSDN